MSKKSIKKTFNIILSVVLVLGVLLSAFGSCMIVLADNKDNTIASQTNIPTQTPEQNQPSGDGGKEEPVMPDLGDAPNTAELNDDVKLFTGAAAEKICNALISVEESYDTYNNNGRMNMTFSGSREELFGELNYGDYFLLDGKTSPSLKNTYIMQVSSIYGNETETYLEVVQPELGEVFENIDIGVSDIISKDNLVSYTAADGVSAYFGDVEKEITNVSYTELFDTAGNNQKLNVASGDDLNVESMATEYSTAETDLIINLEYDLKKNLDSKKDEDNNSTMEFDAGYDLKLTGKLGIEDLTAYMVCDMPKPAQFNELFFGVRGKTVVGAEFDATLNASFNPKATKFEYDGLFIDAEISGLNEKWIPLGIWQFVGSTAIKISKDGFETANAAPSVFIMLYMDAEGNFEIGFNTSLTYESTFNSGLSVYKDGKLNMNVTTYPYAVINGESVAPGEKKLVWGAELDVDFNSSLTVLGSSVQFYIAGINLGEIQLLDVGFEGNCDITVSADSVSGVKTPLDDEDASYYLRMFLRALGIKAKISAEVEAFQRDLSGNFEFAYQLVDATLFEIGKQPNAPNRKPVSSKWVPSEFESLICIVGDVSGSMDQSMGSGTTRIEALRESAHVITNVVEISSEQYEGNHGLAIVQFDDTAQTVAVPHNDYEFINACIDTLQTNGSTNITAGLKNGIDQLINTNANQKVIILMTDGIDNCSSDSQILEQARRAKDNGIKIFSIGFGDSADADILQQVADIAGGEYRFSSTDSIANIIGGFLYSYQASQGEVLVDYQSTIKEGEIVTVDSFTVPDKSGDLNTVLWWPGSILDIILVDPNGREVDADYPGATIDDETIPATVTVKDPLPGDWEFKVKGVETSYEDEPFYAIASFKDIEREENTNQALNTTLTLAAYSLPIGAFMILVSVVLLILINKKKKESL